jgi:hypothetical protein
MVSVPNCVLDQPTCSGGVMFRSGLGRTQWRSCMAPALYKDTNYSLTHGVIGLPDIQRPFVWTATKTRDLFDSMYRGYPVGTLMFWGWAVAAHTVVSHEREAPRVLVAR